MLFGWYQNFFKSLMFMTVFRLVFNIVKNAIVSSLSCVHRPLFRRPLLFLTLVFIILLGARSAVRSGLILGCVWNWWRAVGWADRSPCLNLYGVCGRFSVFTDFSWFLGGFSTFLCCICAHVASGWGSGTLFPWIWLDLKIRSPNAGGKSCMPSLCFGGWREPRDNTLFDSVCLLEWFSCVMFSSRVCFWWRGGCRFLVRISLVFSCVTTPPIRISPFT